MKELDMNLVTGGVVRLLLGILASIAIIFVAVACKSDQAPVKISDPHSNTAAPVPVVPATPSGSDHPTFHILQRHVDEAVSAVVPAKTTDEQIKSLLWYLHATVQAKQFAKLGLKPTTEGSGNPNFDAGIIDVYRTDLCAKENWVDAGPDVCGYGEHQAAEYMWGGKYGPSADDASLIRSDGTRIPIFRFNEPEPGSY